MIIKNIFSLFTIYLLLGFLYGCVFLKDSDDKYVEEELIIDTTILEANSPDLINEEIFPEKRRKKVLTFIDTKFDQDSDGVNSDDDQYPLDSAYPFIKINSISFDNETIDFMGNITASGSDELNNRQINYKVEMTPIWESLKISLFSNVNFRYDSEKEKIETFPLSHNYDGEQMVSISSHANKEIYVQIDLARCALNSDGLIRLLIQVEECSFTIGTVNYTSTEEPITIYLEPNASELKISIINGNYYEVYPEVNVEAYMYDDVSSIIGTAPEEAIPSINDNALTVSYYELSKDNLSTLTTHKFSEKIIQIMGKLYDAYFLKKNPEVVERELFKILSNDEGFLRQLAEFNNDSHLNLTSIATNLGLPNSDEDWSNLPYESLFLASMNASNNIKNFTINNFDNIILKDPISNKGESDGVTDVMSITVPEYLDISKLIVAKLVSIKADGAFSNRLFIHTKYNMSQNFEIPFEDDVYIDFHGLEKAGFIIDDDFNTIQYPIL